MAEMFDTSDWADAPAQKRSAPSSAGKPGGAPGVYSTDDWAPLPVEKPRAAKTEAFTWGGLAHDIARKAQLGRNAVVQAGAETLALPNTLAKAAASEAPEIAREAMQHDLGSEIAPQPQPPEHEVKRHEAVTHAIRTLADTVASHTPTAEDVGKAAARVPAIGGIKPYDPEVKPETTTEVYGTEAVKAATPTLLGKATRVQRGIQMGTAAIGGMAGELASNMSESHPQLARFLTNVSVLLAGGVAAGTVKGGGIAAKKIGEAATKEGQETIAARSLVTASGEKDAATLANKVDQGSAPIVPGSMPTTAQAANSPNLQAALDKSTAESSEQASRVAQRSTEQNEARLTHSGTIEPTGDPQKMQEHIQGSRDRAVAIMDDGEKNAAARIQQRIEAHGPGITPERAGVIIQEEAEAGHEAARQAVNKSFAEVVGPGRQGVVGIDPDPAMRRIEALVKERFGRKNPPPSDVRMLMDDIANEGQKLSYKDMQDLVARTKDMIEKANPNSQAVLLKVRDILLERMDASASETARVLPYKQHPEVEARTIKDRLVRLNELRDIDGGMGPLKKWSASREALENKITEIEGRVKAQHNIENNLEPQEWMRYQNAQDLRDQMVQRYQKGAVGDIRASGKEVGSTKLTPSEVPAALFHARKGSTAEDMAQFRDTLGGKENAQAALREYAVGNLQRVVKEKGLTSDVLRKWVGDHDVALNQFPELKRELSDIMGAQRALADFSETAKGMVTDYNKSAARHFLSKDAQSPVDPEVAIKNAMSPGNRTGKADMAELSRLAALDKSGEATAGLRRGVVEHAIRETGELGEDGLSVLRSKKFAGWMRQNQEKVTPVFTPEHIATLERIQQDLARGQGPGGVAGGGRTLAQTMQAIISGNRAMLQKIPSAGVGKMLFSFLYGKSEAAIKDAFDAMLLDPKRAAAALRKLDDPNAVSAVRQIFGAAGSTTLKGTIEPGSRYINSTEGPEKQTMLYRPPPKRVKNFPGVEDILKKTKPANKEPTQVA